MTRLVASLIDVTDRLKAEADLRASEDRYRRLLSESPMGQAVVSTQGVILEANRAMAAIVRCNPETLTGRNVSDMIHPDDVERALVMMASQGAGEVDNTQIEIRVQRDDGEMAWVLATSSLIRDDADEPQSFHVAAQDTTDQRAAEERLRTSENRYRTMVDSLHEGILIFSAERIEAANQSAADILGVSVAELLADPGMLSRDDPIHPDGRPFSHDERPGRLAMAEGRPVSDVIMGVETPRAGFRWLSMNASPLRDEGHITGVVASISDITERKLAVDALRGREERYRHLVENSPMGQFTADLDGQITEANQALSEMLGYPIDEIVGMHPDDLLDQPQQDELSSRVAELVRGDVDRFSIELRLRGGDGQDVWTIANATMIHDAEGNATHFLTLVQDVTKRRAAEEESRRLANIVESTSDLVGLIDFPSGRLGYLNRAARELFGFIGEDVTKVAAMRLYGTSAVQTFETAIAPAVRRGTSWTGELEMRRDDGGIVPVLQTVTGRVDADGEVTELWSVGRDITERKRKEVDLAHQATHDPLTDLPNRALLLDHLEMALARATRSQNSVALLFLDLDRFKTVNDNLGHEAGDELLVEVSERIRTVLRPVDTLARLGGDEFVILCDDIVDEHHAVTVAERVAAAIEIRPFDLGGASLTVTASIGIALATDEHTHPEALLRDADAAMYRAKDRGRSRHELFDEAMRRRSARRHEVAEELAEAIDRGEIAVHYQPIIDLETGLVTSVEALARWEHPDRGILPPYEFIG
jgi:diguanylate cyclase (GGDEF)-like protein/PAS domain S-box-containing protein